MVCVQVLHCHVTGRNVTLVVQGPLKRCRFLHEVSDQLGSQRQENHFKN